MNVTLLQMILILASGLAAGFINTMAGGGTFLSLAALELAGMPATLANGTNRVAVEIQNIFAVLGFRSKGVGDWKASLQFAIPALFGAILGAYVVINLPTLIFHRVLAVAMILMLFALITNPNKWLQGRQVTFTPRRRLLSFAVFFGVGVYGGAIQAGVGILLMAALVLVAGLNLVQTNSHKVFVVGIYTIFALLMFALQGQVNWVLGLVLSVGNGLGGWIASRLAVAKGEQIVRVVLGVMLAVLTIRYLHIIPGF